MRIAGRTVITYGTFDLFHVGHLNLLERARRLGDQLVVAVSTDEFNSVKGKQCVIPYKDRARIVGALQCVAKVIPENDWEQKHRDVALYGVSTFVMGDDWKGKFDFLTAYCKVVYLPRTEGVSTTDVRQWVVARPRQVMAIGAASE